MSGTEYHRSCLDCGTSTASERYAVPAQRAADGKLVAARAGEAWRCGACSLVAAREGR